MTNIFGSSTMRARLVVLATAIIAAAPTWAAGAPASDAKALVQQAIDAYTAAMETKTRDQRLRQFEIAEQLFRQVIAGDDRHAPIQTPQLLVNLGNAALQAEHFGPAILAYRRALELEPSNATARQNLDYARSLLPEWARREANHQWFDSLFFWRALLGRRQVALVAAVLFLAAAVLLAVGLVRRTLLWRNLALLPALAWLVLSLSLVFDPTYATQDEAVIVMETVVRSADSENAARRTSKPLPSGTEVHVLQQRAHWSEVRLPDGRTGWVRNSAVRHVRTELGIRN